MIIASAYKDVSKIIKSGQGFINPVAEKANIFKQQAQSLDVNELATKAENIATKLNISNPSQFASDIAAIPAKINTAMNTIDNFKSHIDQLSGVVLDGEKNLVGLIELAKAAQDIVKECSDNPDDENSYKNNPMYKLFGSVMDAGKHNQRFESAQKKINEIIDFFNIDELSDYLQSLPENERIQAIKKKLDGIKEIYDNIHGKLEEAKQFDEDAYTELKNEVLSQVVTATLSSLVGDRCANQVISKVKSPELNKALKQAKQVTETAKQAKNIVKNAL